MPYKDKSADWLFFAESDLQSAQATFEEKIYHTASFHAHQTVEKSLKAFLIYKQSRAPKTHSISSLFYSCVKLGLKGLNEKEVIFIDQFYFPTRYPDTLPGSLPKSLPQKEDAAKAIAIAKKVFKVIKNSLV